MNQAIAKPDGNWRLVTNYKALNKLIVPDTRYLKNTESTLTSPDQGLFLSEIYLASGFWSVMEKKTVKEKQPLLIKHSSVFTIDSFKIIVTQQMYFRQ